MTTIDWRGLCEELLRELENAIAVHYGEGGTHHISAADAVITKADAALAQPEPEVVGPTDEELDAWITECADATRYGPLEHYWAFDVQFDHVRDIARAVVARWGRPAPVPAEGEVAELVRWLRLTGEGQPRLSDEGYARLTRAADLLERQAGPVPVAVADRLPKPEDRDEQSRCWWLTLDWEVPALWKQSSTVTHWLPAHALQLPVATPAGQEGA